MTLKSYLETQHITQQSIAKRMTIGAAIGLCIISVFVFSVDNPNPDWGKFWIIRPLLVVPFVGAMASLVFYSKELVNTQSNWKNAAILFFSAILFIIGLWIGTVLGLAGTLWN